METEAPEVPTDETGSQEEAVKNEESKAEESAPIAKVTEEAEVSEDNEQQIEAEETDVTDTHENKGIRKRIDKLNTKVEDAEQRAIDAEFELARVKKDQEVVVTTPAPTQTRPEAGSFETYEEYEDALLDWRIDSKESKRVATTQKAALQRQQDDAARNFDRRAEELKEEHPDFEKVAKAPAMLNFYGNNPIVRDLVESSDLGPEIALHFGKNKDAATNIASMSMMQAAKEIGKLEIKLSTALKPKAVSKASTPINPIKGGGGANIDLGDDPLGDSLTTKEWFKREEAKTAKR